MNDPKDDSLLREIDEDLRREKYEKLWKRYGNYVLGAAALLVIAVAGHQLWQHEERRSHEEAARAFIAATTQARSDANAAEAQLTALIEDGPSGYAMLATFQKAGLLARNNDRPAARALYKSLQETAPDTTYRELAGLLDALTALEGEALPLDADAIRERLQPLAAEGKPWRFTARELIALLAWRSGQTSEARSLLSGLTTDAATPADVRGRAQQLLAQLGAP